MLGRARGEFVRQSRGEIDEALFSFGIELIHCAAPCRRSFIASRRLLALKRGVDRVDQRGGPWIEQHPRSHLVHRIAEADLGVGVGKSERTPAPGWPNERAFGPSGEPGSDIIKPRLKRVVNPRTASIPLDCSV